MDRFIFFKTFHCHLLRKYGNTKEIEILTNRNIKVHLKAEWRKKATVLNVELVSSNVKKENEWFYVKYLFNINNPAT
jgi:uncharacterized protein YchJ